MHELCNWTSHAQTPRQLLALAPWAIALTAALFAESWPAAAAPPRLAAERWTATWTGAAMAPGSALGVSHAFENQTLRQVCCT